MPAGNCTAIVSSFGAMLAFGQFFFWLLAGNF
jgi:hypothetical protein